MKHSIKRGEGARHVCCCTIKDGVGDDGAAGPLPREGRDGSESLKFSEPLTNLVGAGLSGTGLGAAVLSLDASCKVTGGKKA